jgi:hypothetical protein
MSEEYPSGPVSNVKATIVRNARLATSLIQSVQGIRHCLPKARKPRKEWMTV